MMNNPRELGTQPPIEEQLINAFSHFQTDLVAVHGTLSQNVEGILLNGLDPKRSRSPHERSWIYIIPKPSSQDEASWILNIFRYLHNKITYEATKDNQNPQVSLLFFYVPENAAVKDMGRLAWRTTLRENTKIEPYGVIQLRTRVAGGNPLGEVPSLINQMLTTSPR